MQFISPQLFLDFSPQLPDSGQPIAEHYTPLWQEGPDIMSKLVIVESPTKAKTIRKFLPNDVIVMASMGHIRDLPDSATEIPAKVKNEKWARLGVNVEADFEPLYVIPRKKAKTVKELKTALKEANELILATDEDREGESISWHLVEALRPTIPVKRMVFHEITKEAVQEALHNCRSIDDKLVRAQETRRILDRLVGYTLSPLLWKKIAYGLSAGRVQSVAVRLIVIRERERRAFKRGSYWDLKAHLSHSHREFEAQLVTLGDKRVASGKDFDPATGRIPDDNKHVILLSEAQSIQLRDRLLKGQWVVEDVEEKAVTRKPAPPFTTSTLQQEANRKLGMSARETIRTAQRLYEEGFITYMRTDSVFLSQQAIHGACGCVERLYGKEYLHSTTRQYQTKSKGAQEAHEAIRPAGSAFRTPQETGLSGRELALYDLIWKRTVATQMAEARQTHLTVSIVAEEARFRATGKRIDFPGFFRAYVEGSDDPDAAIDNQEVILPNLKKGDQPRCQKLDPVGHETQPPARYTEASLVKTLEAEGIGRPSTYASIISTIQDRGYVQLMGNALAPTFTAFAVTALLEKNFPNLVDTGFTAKMEQSLDDIADGTLEWLPYLRAFYNGQKGLEAQVKSHESTIDPEEARTVELGNLTAKVRIGRFGPYVESQNNGESLNASIPATVTPADLSNETVDEIIRLKAEGPNRLGVDPDSQEPVYLLTGAYGPYVQRGEIENNDKKKIKRVSLPKGKEMAEVDLAYGLKLLELPRTLGNHPQTGGKIQAGLGRFGPYIVHNMGSNEKDYRSIKAPDTVLEIGLERALEMLLEPKKGRGRRSASKTPLRELGLHPEDKTSVAIFDGPYGHYVKHGKINASIPKEKAVETVTLEEALVWLKEKAGTKGSKAPKKKASKKKKVSKT